MRATTLLVAASLAGLGAAVTVPVAAAAATLEVSLITTSLEVSGSEPSSRVTLTGTVANTGELPAYGVQVILWRSRDPIRDLPTLRRANSEATGWGSRLPITPEHYEVITTSLGAFAPGATRTVALSATLEELGFDTAGAAYAFGADVIASPGQRGAYVTVGQVRTFVPVPGKRPVPLTSIVLLDAPPTKLLDNLFRSEELSFALGGRLDSLLTAAARPGMSWLVDPALLDEVRDMADGYSVTHGDSTVEGSGQQVAAAWLARFDRLDPDAGARTLFAAPDVNGARLAGDENVVDRAEAAAAEVSRVEDLPLVVVPAGRVAGAATYDYLADSGATAVLASNATHAGALQAGTGKARVLATSGELPAATDTPAIERRQLALAAAVVAGRGGQARLLASLNDLVQDQAATASWLQRRNLGDLLAGTPGATPATFSAVRPERLADDQFAGLARLERDFDTYAELVPKSAYTGQADAALSRAAASAWVGDPDGFRDQLGGLNRLVGPPATGRAVTLDASGRFLMSARSNQFPVTVTNHLTERVLVKVVVTTDNPQRLRVPPTELVSVEPGQSQTVNVRPEASANGLVIARAHVATETGVRVSPDTTVTVEVTDLGVVAWIIVGVSGLVLVGATAWRIRQVRRRTEGQAAEQGA